jgi:hypothetical protein
MKKNFTMIVNRKYDSNFQSRFYRNIEKALTERVKMENPGEMALKSVLQFACSYEVLNTRSVGTVETLLN